LAQFSTVPTLARDYDFVNTIFGYPKALICKQMRVALEGEFSARTANFAARLFSSLYEKARATGYITGFDAMESMTPGYPSPELFGGGNRDNLGDRRVTLWMPD